MQYHRTGMLISYLLYDEFDIHWYVQHFEYIYGTVVEGSTDYMYAETNHILHGGIFALICAARNYYVNMLKGHSILHDEPDTST